MAGGLEPKEVAADPDLFPLRDDHRFAFYENTGLLSRAERDYVNAYHARVLKEIGPKLDTEVKAWLEKACRPI